jgi:hypothetical protein
MRWPGRNYNNSKTVQNRDVFTTKWELCSRKVFMQNNHMNDKQAARGNFFERHDNQIVVALWILALASHAILIPKFIKEVLQ